MLRIIIVMITIMIIKMILIWVIEIKIIIVIIIMVCKSLLEIGTSTETFWQQSFGKNSKRKRTITTIAEELSAIHDKFSDSGYY